MAAAGAGVRPRMRPRRGAPNSPPGPEPAHPHPPPVPAVSAIRSGRGACGHGRSGPWWPGRAPTARDAAVAPGSGRSTWDAARRAAELSANNGPLVFRWRN